MIADPTELLFNWILSNCSSKNLATMCYFYWVAVISELLVVLQNIFVAYEEIFIIVFQG